MTVLGYLAKLVLGVLGLIVSVTWVAHIVIYLLIDPPLFAFLNEIFIKLDDVWGLLSTAAFAFFCFYLLLAVIAGAMMLGLKLFFITIHPMKWGATLTNSFIFNVGLILLCSIRYSHGKKGIMNDEYVAISDEVMKSEGGSSSDEYSADLKCKLNPIPDFSGGEDSDEDEGDGGDTTYLERPQSSRSRGW